MLVGFHNLDSYFSRQRNAICHRVIFVPTAGATREINIRLRVCMDKCDSQYSWTRSGAEAITFSCSGPECVSSTACKVSGTRSGVLELPHWESRDSHGPATCSGLGYHCLSEIAWHHMFVPLHSPILLGEVANPKSHHSAENSCALACRHMKIGRTQWNFCCCLWRKTSCEVGPAQKSPSHRAPLAGTMSVQIFQNGDRPHRMRACQRNPVSAPTCYLRRLLLPPLICWVPSSLRPSRRRR